MVKKLITLDGLTVFLSELRKEINAGAGKCFDAEELARRIPSWQWKVTMPQTVNQTVTATVGTQTYTNDFYAPQGSQITFSAKADAGYKAGTLSLESATLTQDVAVTVTEATEKLADGSLSFPPEYFENREDFELEVPRGVNVLKLDTHLRSDNDPNVFREPLYFKVVPGTKLLWTGDLYKGRPHRNIAAVNHIEFDPRIFVSNIRYGDDREFTFYWGEQINEHTTDTDLTELSNKWIISHSTKLLVPDRFNVLKMEVGDNIKYVKLGEKRTLAVEFAPSPIYLSIENKRIFYIKGSTQKTCTVSWSDEIDTHTPDIEL